MIATGGTIACRETERGLSPQITSKELLSWVPCLEELCETETLQLYNLDSTNLYSVHWIEIAACIERNYKNYDGFVITHGTDTLAYTSAALSYLIQNSKKPIVLTGAQRSIYCEDTDARENLYDAFLFAVNEKSRGVHIVFGGKVISGTRAKKTRTKSYNAFSTIDFPEIAIVRNRKIVFFVEEKSKQDVVFFHNMNPRVFVWKLIPGANADFLLNILDQYDALIIESFGVGGIPYYENEAFSDAIRIWIEHGRKVIVTTQVQHEGSDMEIYKVGYEIKKKLNLIEAYDMTIEAVVTKVMWALAVAGDNEEFHRLFYLPIDHDII